MVGRRPQTLRRIVGRKLLALTISWTIIVAGFFLMSLRTDAPSPAPMPVPELVDKTGDAERLIVK
ncbi:MAG: hypothetical protein L0H93_16925 [Nocardioides sp.]|nr:hypothetical protein [Nocardioides sp.]